jgi:GNAT superfamily N-acetyltransferase
MDIEFKSAEGVSHERLIEAFMNGYHGYFVNVALNQRILLHMIRADSVDLPSSLVAMNGEKIIGLAAIARRGWTSRLAAMGILPEFRGKKIGTALLKRALDDARGRGERAMVLETIEQNEPARRLYQAAGFKTVRRLVGYVCPTVVPAPDSALDEIDPLDVSERVAQWSMPDLPWQIAPQTLAALNPPHRGYGLGPAFALLTDPSANPITFRSLVVDPFKRKQGWATRLVRALAAAFPEKTWRFSAHVPEEIPFQFFTSLGFEKDKLTQLQMERTLLV